MEWVFWCLAVVYAGSILLLLKIAKTIWWKPLQVKKYFEAQGIRGPPYRLVYGNSQDVFRMMDVQRSRPMPALSHDIIPRVLPHIHHWTKTYGEKWAKHRKIINPAFHMDLLKGMVPTIVKSSASVLDEWSRLILSGSPEIEVGKEFHDLTADVIARTAFGSSFTEGKHIFDLQAKQMVLAVESFRSVYIPCFRFLPTKKNRQRWNLEKEIRKSLRQVIDARDKTARMEEKGRYGNDLLGLMMSQSKDQGRISVKSNASLTTDEIIDECKTFYFAGNETTAVLLTWSIILLGMHQDWQEKGRREVLQVCGRNKYPDADSLNRLKIVGMIINETLRLYPPAVFVRRQASDATKLGRLSIPAGTHLELHILAIHHDPALWGSDANDFNPGRFSEGIAKAAKHPMAFMPFGAGQYICVGQNFALLEAKLVLAMILQKFYFATSPSYTHAPVLSMTLRPQYGAQVIFRMG